MHTHTNAFAGIVASMNDREITGFGLVFSKTLSSSKIDGNVANLEGHSALQPRNEIAATYDNTKVRGMRSAVPM